MKKVLITAVGGPGSTNFLRSLREATEPFHLIGTDANKYNLWRAQPNEKYLVPYADDNRYLDVLIDIINETKPEFIYGHTDKERLVISENRKKIGAFVFLPDHKTVEICEDKYKLYEMWKKAGMKIPASVKIDDENSLKKAFETLGTPLWVRATVSPGGGKGSLKVDKFHIAKAWIDFCNGWGNFVASEYLSNQSVTWMSIWKEGELIIAQGRKRIYWDMASATPSGVSGITGVATTISDPLVDKIAQEAIFAVDKNPNGVFSVDMTYDSNSIPNPTEIMGRFFTTQFFFTKAGVNMPYIYVKLAYGEKPPKIKKKINPLPSGLYWIRGVDFEPILATAEQIAIGEEELRKRLAKIESN